MIQDTSQMTHFENTASFEASIPDREKNTSCWGRLAVKDSTPSKYILDQFNEGRLIAKMLEHYSDDYDRTETELSELKCQYQARSASTSLLIPHVPAKLFRKIGLLIDADRSHIRYICDKDAMSNPLDDYGNEVYWSKEKSRYGICEPRSYFGRFSVQRDHTFPTQKCKQKFLDNNPWTKGFTNFKCRRSPFISIFDLKNHLSNKSKKQSGEVLDINELIINYSKDSIVGVVISTEKTPQKHEIDCAKEVGMRSTRLLDRKLDCFHYNPSTGELTAMNT